MKKKYYIILIIMICLQQLFAQEKKQKTWSEPPWAIGMAVRSAFIPFETEGDKYVATVVPLIYYEGKRFYFWGTEGGFIIHRHKNWRFGAIGRMRFFDVPEQYQNQIQGDAVLWGLQARYIPTELSFVDLELVSDWRWNYAANIRAGIRIQFGNVRITPNAMFKFKSSAYNSYYYGLNLEDINGGMEWSLGVVASLRLWSNLYVYGSAKLTHLEKNVRDVEFVRNEFVPQIFLGAGFSNDYSKPLKEELSISPYVRLAHGWASTASLNEIIRFKNESDPYNNQLTNIFYGHPLTDRIFGLPVHFFLTSGLVYHWSSSVQESALEIVLAIKFYVPIPWPVRWRIGFAEGWSYVNNVPYVERSDLEGKDYKTSNLLNYLDPSLDINIGDIFGGDQLKHFWLGWSLHHRSGIFGTAQQFGRISGGSNYNTVYLLYHF
jgi:outer membrane protein